MNKYKRIFCCCQIARNMTKDGDIKVARVIAVLL